MSYKLLVQWYYKIDLEKHGKQRVNINDIINEQNNNLRFKDLDYLSNIDGLKGNDTMHDSLLLIKMFLDKGLSNHLNSLFSNSCSEEISKR